MADTLMTDVEAEALDSVLETANWTKLHNDSATGDLEDAAKIVDILIYDQPPSTTKVTGYRMYDGINEDISVISEPGFLVLSKAKINNSIEFTVFPGNQYIETGGAYILGRDHAILITTEDSGQKGLVLPQGGEGYSSLANSLDTLTASAKPIVRITLNSGGIDPLAVAKKQAIVAKLKAAEEFYNHAHGRGGRFTSGGGSSGGSSGGSAGGSSGGSAGAKTTGQKAASIAKKALVVAAIVAVVVGAVALGVHTNNTVAANKQKADAQRAAERDALNKRSAEMQKHWEAHAKADRDFIEGMAKIRAENKAKHGPAKSIESGPATAESKAAAKRLESGKSTPAEKAAASEKLGTAGGAGRSQAAGNTLGGHISERYDPGTGGTADERLRSREAARGAAHQRAQAAGQTRYPTHSPGGTPLGSAHHTNPVDKAIVAEQEKRLAAAQARGQAARAAQDAENKRRYEARQSSVHKANAAASKNPGHGRQGPSAGTGS